VSGTAGSSPGEAAGGRGQSGDRIQLRGLRTVGTHGVLPEEKGRAQPFEIDLDLAVDLAPAASSDRLSDTVDYGGVAEAAIGIVAGSPSYELLEALAGRVAEASLATDPRITAVTVYLRKLHPPLALDIATVGVRLTRVR